MGGLSHGKRFIGQLHLVKGGSLLFFSPRRREKTGNSCFASIRVIRGEESGFRSSVFIEAKLSVVGGSDAIARRFDEPMPYELLDAGKYSTLGFTNSHGDSFTVVRRTWWKK